MNKQKNISSAARSLFLNCLCEPSVFTGKLEMKTEDEVDFRKDHAKSAAREEAVSATYAYVTLSFSVLFKETSSLLRPASEPAGFLSVAVAKLSGVHHRDVVLAFQK